MTYSKAKLKSGGDRAYPCFRTFWIGKLSGKSRLYYDGRQSQQSLFISSISLT
jgi:hypothetical protein